MFSNISSTSLQSWRERPPSSYSIKGKNFSQSESSILYSDGKYQSRSFSSGDYKWRIVIYPKGNHKDNGSGFISMYVEIDSRSLISTTPTEVYADLRYFVFNKKENKYFTIQDLCGIEAVQYTKNNVKTVESASACHTFNDNENGFLFDGDHCEFGVDVIVAPPPAKGEILSLDVKLPYPKFYWTVKNFSEIKGDIRASNSFSMGGMKWVLKLYPKGYSIKDNKWLSIFIFLDDGEILKEDEKVYLKVQLKVQNPSGSNHLIRDLNYWLEERITGFRLYHLVSIAELRKSYLDKEDTLNVEIKFEGEKC